MTLHVHRCSRCEQAEIHCERQDCYVPDDWECPSCTFETRDEYFQAVGLDYEIHRLEEQLNDLKRHVSTQPTTNQEPN